MTDPGGGKPRTGARKPNNDRHPRDIGVQVGKSAKAQRSRCWNFMACSIWTSAVVVAVVATIPFWNDTAAMLEELFFTQDFMVGSQMMEDLGMEGVVIFKQHDRNGDGVLSIEEFEPIAHRLIEAHDDKEYELAINEWDEVITIQSFFSPLNMSTMTKAKDEIEMPREVRTLSTLHGLKYWKKPVQEWKNFAAEHFKPFLPKDPYLLDSMGEVYDLVRSLDETNSGAVLSSNRYVPPPYVGEAERMIHRLLAMFHPRPFVYTRFGPQGAVAIVRATNEKYVDISFRIHAEFQLNEPPFHPFWFTPAQFMGNIVMSKDGSKVVSFNMYVPSDRRLNVDMEWQNGPKEEENMEVDIGKMKQMELRATRDSIHVLDGGVNYTEKFIPRDEGVERVIMWGEEISAQKAQRELEVKLYPFKKVVYHNFTDAFLLAREKNKPVHSILLWGALDDQSC